MGDGESLRLGYSSLEFVKRIEWGLNTSTARNEVKGKVLLLWPSLDVLGKMVGHSIKRGGNDKQL